MISAFSESSFSEPVFREPSLSEPSRVHAPQGQPMGERSLSPRYARRLARSEGYLRAASRKFLEGTSFRSPVEAVESGAKSVLEWCDCLALARLEYRVNAHLYGE